MAALYGFSYAPQALANLATIPLKIRKQIVAKINKLAAAPHPPGCKAIKGMSDGDD